MSLNNVASAERLHIGFFGKRNAGKSSLVNAVTGQQLCVVSDVLGTTTDPVKKAMELLPLGPVVIVDTPGIDDEGELGSLRVKKAKEALDYTDIAIVVVDARQGLSEYENELIKVLQSKKTPYIVAYNKADLLEEQPQAQGNEIYVSAVSGKNIFELKEMLGKFASKEERKVVSDLLKAGDVVVLVVPIDKAAPKGRLIMPQQLTIRDILDGGAVAVVCRDSELKQTLDGLAVKPKMVITDSQVFGKVAKIVPGDTLLTSFSILMARYKGNLPTLLKGAAKLDKLNDGDKILIAEGCTHHRQCEDIGTVKIPKWLTAYTGKKLNFEFCSGTEFPSLDGYALVVHCGGCTLNEKEMTSRTQKAINVDIPITNYGLAIAHVNGILRRSLSPFADMTALLEQ
ncbi:MAG: [FeFe] hydrogenase H-cluster maturation GTPase HydF [Clostridiales bacterium]|nr:[FeFe] hydrogenase H-cluster maturation GTPase HydF [Clostridiales bacterium]